MTPIVSLLLVACIGVVLANSGSQAEEYQAFISYRRAPSKHLAMLIKVLLRERNINAYVDVEDLTGGLYHPQLMEHIQSARNFILVLSQGSLEKAKNDWSYADIVHQEIKAAVDQGKRIIPVFDDNYDWPASSFFTEEIKTALDYQGVLWQHHLVEQSLERLISYMDFDTQSPSTVPPATTTAGRTSTSAPPKPTTLPSLPPGYNYNTAPAWASAFG